MAIRIAVRIHEGRQSFGQQKGWRITGCRFTTSIREEQGNIVQECQQTEGQEMEKKLREITAKFIIKEHTSMEAISKELIGVKRRWGSYNQSFCKVLCNNKNTYRERIYIRN